MRFFLLFYVATIQLMTNRVNYEGTSSINILDILQTRPKNRIHHFFILPFKIHLQSPDLFKESNKPTLSVYPREKWNCCNEYTACLRFKIWQMVQSPFCFLGCASSVKWRYRKLYHKLLSYRELVTRQLTWTDWKHFWNSRPWNNCFLPLLGNKKKSYWVILRIEYKILTIECLSVDLSEFSLKVISFLTLSFNSYTNMRG